jgi:DNA (cytosine-5)-methyltransferase 1
MENVTGAALYNPLYLSGQQFGLKVIRRRLFESNVLLLAPSYMPPAGSVKTGEYVTVAGHGGDSKDCRLATWQEAMGINWTTKEELVQAIPPAYTRFIGLQLKQFIAQKGA